MNAGAILSMAAIALAFGCGNSEPGASPDSGVGGDGGGGVDSGTTRGDAGSGGDAGTAIPGTPVLLTASLVTHGTMSLSWSLSWQNPTSTCATVEINRKKDAGVYSVAQRLTGQATSAQDMPGHANGTYCYTITCNLNGFASAPSNEKCVTQ